MSGRLVCVSNRTGTTKSPSGGLAVALSAALRGTAIPRLKLTT